MDNFMSNSRLREELQGITDKYIGHLVGQQIKLIAELSSRYNHSIRLKGEAKLGMPKTFRYNCYQYAFDTITSPQIEKIASIHQSIFPNSEFIIFLIRNGILREINWEDRRNGDIIIYFANTKPAHAGKINSDKIISKWGLAHLWEHNIYEVPISYGTEFKIFSRVDSNLCVSSFIEYAKSKGVILDSEYYNR